MPEGISAAWRNELRRRVRGNVHFDAARLATYATDASNYRQIPLAVVWPRDEDDIIQALACCQDAGLPALARGAGTSLAGQACNRAVVLDVSVYMNRVLNVDPDSRTALVQPGAVLDDLRRQASPFGLTFGPDPATHAWCTLGGMVGNNSCGAHALYAGKTVENVDSLTVTTYRGDRISVGKGGSVSDHQAVPRELDKELHAIEQLYGELIRERFPQIPRRVSGYNLDQLLPENGFHLARALVGTESTCVITLEASLRLIESPSQRVLVLMGFPNIYAAADAVPTILEAASGLLALEGFDSTLTAQMVAARLNLAELGLLPQGGGWLLAEVGADEADDALAMAEDLARNLRPLVDASVIQDPRDQAAIWRIRESALGATARPPGQDPNFEGWEDAAVAPGLLGKYLRGIAELWRRYGYSGAWYGHFGQGCVHTRNNFDFSTTEGLRRFRSYIEEAARLTVELGGSLSGEHGDGQARGELLEVMYGPELLQAFRRFKAAWDPDGMMNPGKLVDARPFDVDLALGPSHRRLEALETVFSYPADGGSFQRAVERCVGVGKCRSLSGGVMCPSFRATRDERHSTRGRARLLEEMLQGEVIKGGWRSKEVLDALDLCLACKGCAVDCPTHVDMATYKAEFYFHHFKGRLRPTDAYLLGLIPFWLSIASRAPALFNAAAKKSALATWIMRRAGITTTRPAPLLASRPLQRVLARRPRPSAPKAVLWPDTFTNYFLPQRGIAALRILDATGSGVLTPNSWVCCGRPFYDFGMLNLARAVLKRSLRVLRSELEAGLSVIVLEPTCLAVFRDELPSLLPNDPLATRLARQAKSLAEYLDQKPEPIRHNRDQLKVYLFPHCHYRAVGGPRADEALLSRLGYQVEVLDVGCCGGAGAFAFQARNAALSEQIARLGFLPAISAIPPDAPVLLDGFSCTLQARYFAIHNTTCLAEFVAQGI